MLLCNVIKSTSTIQLSSHGLLCLWDINVNMEANDAYPQGITNIILNLQPFSCRPVHVNFQYTEQQALSSIILVIGHLYERT
jgi:hypothetical protein